MILLTSEEPKSKFIVVEGRGNLYTDLLAYLVGPDITDIDASI